NEVVKAITKYEKDKAVWIDRNGKESIFSIRQVWKDITFDETRVDWYKIVWFGKNIPRHAFVLWMAVQNNKIAAWKTNEKMECVFCKECLDSVNIFFNVITLNMYGKKPRTVYYTWQERNSRVFKGEKRDEKVLLQIIKETVQMKIAGFEVKESKAVEEVEERWNIKIQKKKK
ncbi:RNA-directed DNA polymerase, eukaryota, reverse transcriptase zinc-binding domain protein, partial [Tanacetum coccineum]